MAWEGGRGNYLETKKGRTFDLSGIKRGIRTGVDKEKGGV